jgi:hypothetical protein
MMRAIEFRREHMAFYGHACMPGKEEPGRSSQPGTVCMHRLHRSMLLPAPRPARHGELLSLSVRCACDGTKASRGTRARVIHCACS